MESIYIIIKYLYYSIFTSIAVYYSVKLAKTRKNKNVKSEIQSIDAKISYLRLNLKSKVKKKSQLLRSMFATPINTGDPVDLLLNELAEILFEKSDEFQKYFDLSRKILGHIKSDVVGTKNEIAAETKEDFMTPDFKNEVSIIMIIKDITDYNLQLESKINSYNFMNSKDKMPSAEQIIFSDLVVVNRIHRHESENYKKDSATEKKKVEAKKAS